MELKKKIILFSLFFLIMSCKKADNDVLVTRVNKEAGSFNNMIFFSGKKKVIGIDPVTLKIGYDIECNTYIHVGPVVRENEVIVADLGKKVGIFGNKLHYINNQGKTTQTIETLLNPYHLLVIDTYLFVDSLVYDENGLSSYSIYDKNTGNLVFRDDKAVNWVTNSNDFIHKDYFLIGIAPFDAKDKESYCLKIPLSDPDIEKIELFTGDNPRELYTLSISGHYLFIIYRTSHYINVFDLRNRQQIKKIDLSFLSQQIPVSNQDLIWLYNPVIYRDILYLLYVDHSSHYDLQKMIRIDLNRLELIDIKNITGLDSVSDWELKTITGHKIFWQNITELAVMDLQDMHIIKHLAFEK